MADYRREITVLAVTLALALAGCSAGSTPNACSLLDADGIFEGAGLAVTNGEIDSDLSGATTSTCVWRPITGTFPVIQVHVSEGADQIAAQRFDTETGTGVGSEDVTIAGARDGYVAGSGTLVGMVVDDFFVQVAYITSEPADVADKTIALAAQVAASF